MPRPATLPRHTECGLPSQTICGPHSPLQRLIGSSFENGDYKWTHPGDHDDHSVVPMRGSGVGERLDDDALLSVIRADHSESAVAAGVDKSEERMSRIEGNRNAKVRAV
tara:strand:- start:2719 stop:3045 length:327 start_codon:yes stop_codon:yes gene_type:complete